MKVVCHSGDLSVVVWKMATTLKHPIIANPIVCRKNELKKYIFRNEYIKKLTFKTGFLLRCVYNTEEQV